jgi:hypothetical protein
MKPSDIPSQVLHEVYQAIADRHETDVARLDRTAISQEEFMAALAFTQGAPLIEADEISEPLLACCQLLSGDLDLDALADYKFVPLAKRGRTLLAISSCPWDAMTKEIISSYFPQCSRVCFVLASSKILMEILDRLKGANAKDVPVAGYTLKPTPVARVVIPQPPDPVPIQQPRSPKADEAPAALPMDQTVPSGQVSNGQKLQTQSLLTPEDATYLVNILAQEASRLLQRRQRKSL